MRYRISKYKHLHSNRFRYLSSSIPLVCASGLLVVLGMMISPVGSLSNTSYAYDSGPDGGGTGGSTTTTPTVELSVASTNLIKPSTTSNINYISTGLTVTALNTDSYGIYVQSTNGSSNLTNNGTTISGVGNNVSTTNFGTNTWGYSVADGTVGEADLPTLTYSTIPTSASSAAKSGTTAEAKPFTLAFAAKFADSATPGHYNGNVLVSVAANPGEVVNGFSGVRYMQELDSLTCYRASEGASAQLLDARDESQYWITKMYDGNCWMTQNLDYNPPTASQQWNPSSWSGTTTANNYAEYYDPGKWVYKDQLSWDGSNAFVCPSNNTKNGLSGCIDYGWLNVSDWTASSDSNMTDVINESEHIYNAHYLVGNYYSFQAATKNIGKDFTSDGQNVTESICPQGWELPKKTGRNSFQNLSMPYYEAVKSPYYLVVGGGVGNGSILNVGYMLYYWTSTVKDANNAYVHGQGGGNPSNTYRFLGNFVRCIKLGVDGL